MWMDGGNLSGDIHSIHPEGEFFTKIFSIELKNGYKSANFDKHLKKNKNDEIKDFWTQCLRDCRKVNKLPILIFKKMRSGTYIAIDSDTYEILKDLLEGLRTITLDWGKDNNEDDLPIAVFMDMKEFFERVKPEHIKNRLG